MPEEDCKNCEMELQPEHTCPDCKYIVHVLFGTYDKSREKYVCGCAAKYSTSRMEVNIIADQVQMADVSTITQSIADETYREIPIDYFITKDQKRNITSKLDGGKEFTKLKADITRSINEKLKAMMIIQA